MFIRLPRPTLSRPSSVFVGLVFACSVSQGIAQTTQQSPNLPPGQPASARTETATATGATQELPVVEVSANAETPWGPVEGYKASYSSTATKSDIPIIDVPAAIQVVPQQVIKDQGATRLWDAVRNVSGVQTAGSSGNRSDGFVIRGFGAERLMKDGFPSGVSFGDMGFLHLANVERVEVLKGPASVLYGQNEPGGVINLVTKKPQPEASHNFDFTYGSYDFYRSEADLNQPLVDDGSLLFRLNTSYENAGSFRDVLTDSERYLIAPSLRWTPTSDTTIDLQLEYYEQRVPNDYGLWVVDGRADVLPRERYLGEAYARNEADELRLNALVDHRINENWTWRTSLRSAWSNARPQMAFAEGMQPGSDRILNRRAYDFDQQMENYAAQTNLNGKFNTGALEHNLLVGLDANFTRFESDNRNGPLASIDIFNPVYGARPGAYGPSSHQDRSYDFYGIYLQDLITFNEHWKLMLGGRYDYVKSQFAANGVTTLDGTDKEFSPRVGLVYQPIKDLSLYASYTESFQPGSFSSGNVDGTPFKPEYGEQIEVGIKRDWFDGRLSTTLAVFELTKTNVLTADPTDPERSIQTGEQRSRGVELDVSGEILPGWRVFGSLAYLDAELTKDNTFPVGNLLPNAPQWSGSLWSSYAFAKGPLDGLELGAGVFATGSRQGNLDNTFSIGGYARVDLFTRYRFNEHLQVSVNVQNLFDEDYIEAADYFSNGYPGAPRSVFVTLSLSF